MSRESRRRSYLRRLEKEYFRKTALAWYTCMSSPTPASRERYYTMVDQAVRSLQQGTAQVDFILDLEEGAKGE